MTTDESDAEDDRLRASGDLATLLARHYDDLVAAARMRVGPQRALDAVQSALTRTLRELASGRAYPIPLRAVLHQHVRWACLDVLGETDPLPLPDGWDGADGSAEDAYRAVEDRLSFDAAIAGLPPRARDVIDLRFGEGLAPEQIAERLGMTRNAVDQALWRGLGALREEWAGG